MRSIKGKGLEGSLVSAVLPQAQGYCTRYPGDTLWDLHPETVTTSARVTV